MRTIKVGQKAMCLYLQVQVLNSMVVEVHIVLVGGLLLACLLAWWLSRFWVIRSRG